MESPGLIHFALVIWGVPATFVALATFGHLWGIRYKMHPLDMILYAAIMGAIWPWWLFRKWKG